MKKAKLQSSNKQYLSTRRQRGTFMVEFALVGLVFAAALAFCTEAVISIATKGKLDRLVYSGVSLLKERTALFDENSLTVSSAEFNQLSNIMQNSFERMTSSFDVRKYGIRLETWTPDADDAVLQTGGALNCSAKAPLTENMSVMTSWGRRASLYRLTVCYEVPSWFSQGQNMVQSSALMIGR